MSFSVKTCFLKNVSIIFHDVICCIYTLIRVDNRKETMSTLCNITTIMFIC